jgi:hypothetical protein
LTTRGICCSHIAIAFRNLSYTGTHKSGTSYSVLLAKAKNEVRLQLSQALENANARAEAAEATLARERQEHAKNMRDAIASAIGQMLADRHQESKEKQQNEP